MVQLSIQFKYQKQVWGGGGGGAAYILSGCMNSQMGTES